MQLNQPTISIHVKPNLPEELAPLALLADNLWFSWNPEAVELFKRLDPELWVQTQHNPRAVLNQLSQERLNSLAKDSGFRAQMDRVASMLYAYLGAEGETFLGNDIPANFTIAYFSAEYGLADCLPIYSGGLGMLSGDHMKSASNLKLPMVGIGLAYGQGYFQQYLNSEGWQQEEYSPNNFYDLPMDLMRDKQGHEIRISVPIEEQTLYARIWRVNVGRVPLYLLDSNIDDNSLELRGLTHQLYGGDTVTRIRQEILLGIGGVRALEALGISPNVYHMNEGHSAFASLERIRLLRAEHGLSFTDARVAVKASNCFTTHTPVPAGNDYFDPELVRRHFQNYVGELGISMPVLMAYGRINPHNQSELFCMTVLALRLSAYNNGVSRLHGEVSRHMWSEVWPQFPLQDVPITHITNGVHIPSWVSGDMAYLYNRYLGQAWMEDPDSEMVWRNVHAIPDTELWRVHERRRGNLVSFIRSRLVQQFRRQGASAEKLRAAAEVLSPDALTIVFARRFATYKRAVLLMRDIDRLAKILNNPDRPVQIIFAGKAHPKDNEGKEFIRQVAALSQQPRFRHQLVFLENYDINVGRYLVQGADVWLNNPRRPLEACGTSGMKAAANGALNVSILDGWWDEGFEPGLGWAIGSREEAYEDENLQDEVEARSLYKTLENEVIPLFYTRDSDHLPRGWIAYMKKCLSRICPQFNTHRMLEDYTHMFYAPAAERFNFVSANDWAMARTLGEWNQRIMENWNNVEVLGMSIDGPERADFTWGENITITARIKMGHMNPEDVAADIYFGPVDGDGKFMNRDIAPMKVTGSDGDVTLYQGKVRCTFNGVMGFKIRVTPYHGAEMSKYALGLAVWG